LDAADALFGEVGFEGATTRRISELSGVNKGLIHYHFKDKQALWNAVLDRYYQDLGATVRGALTGPGDLRDRLVALVGSYLDFLVAHRTFARMVQREAAGGRHVERITEVMVPLFETGAALIEAAFPKTRQGPMAAAHLLVSFYGMAVTWVTYAPVVAGLTGDDPLGPDAIAQRKAHLASMVDLVVGQLREP
jgi:AcrR family transcriptional regulator